MPQSKSIIKQIKNSKTWNIGCVELGRADLEWIYDETLQAKEPDLDYQKFKYKDGLNQPSSSIYFYDDLCKAVDFTSNSIEVTKGWNFPYHTDKITYTDSFLMLVPYRSFFFQIKGFDEVKLKKGRCYIFNQRRLHRAHNNSKSFVCAVAAVNKESILRYIKDKK